MSDKRWYAVTLRAECEMGVMVQATSPAEARRLARKGEYEDMTHWEPLTWPVRARRPDPRPDYEPPEDA